MDYVCHRCNGILAHEVAKEQCTEVNTDFTYYYTMEYMVCMRCGDEIVLTVQIQQNDIAREIAKKEATVVYKMKKWLTKQ